MKKILKNDYVKSFGGQVAMAASNMIAFSILARMLTKVELGNWTLILTITVFVENFRSGFFSAAYTKFVGSEQYPQESVGFTVLVMNLVGHVFIAVLIGLFWYFLTDMRLMLLYVIILITGSLCFDFVQWHTLASKDFTKNTQIILIQSGLNLLLLAFVAVYDSLNLRWVVIITLISKVVTTVLYLGAFRSFVAARAKVLSEVSRSIIGFGKHTAATLLGSQAMRLTDVTLLNWMAGPVMVALLAVPDKLVQVVAIPIRSINRAYYPKASMLHSVGNDDGWKKEFSMTLTIVLLLCFGISLFVMVLAEPLVILIGGTEFAHAAGILRLYILVICVNSVATLLGVSMESVGRPKVNSTLLMILVPVNLVADYLALRMFPRPEAVILVTLLTACIGLIWLYTEIKRCTSFTFKDYISHGFKSSLHKLLVSTKLVR